MRHPSTRVLFAYWDQVRGERAAPERADIEPERIRHILGDVFIAEIDEARLLPFRVAGTRLCALVGHELRGRSFVALWDAAGQAETQRLVAHLLAGTVGAVAGVRGETQAGRLIDGEILLLPLRHHGRTHSRMIGALTLGGQPPWLGHDRLGPLSMSSLRMIDPAEPPASAGFARGAPAVERRAPHLRVLPGGREAGRGAIGADR